jgi:ABC-2 type transport system ATP-binding protein
LDEPANGMDPQGIMDMRALLKALNREGKTILISSHILSELAQFATKVGVISRGALLSEKGIAEIHASLGESFTFRTADPAAVAAYFTEKGGAVTVVEDKTEVRGIAVDGLADANALAARGIAVKGFWQEEETLESYFFKVTEGEIHA